MPVYEYLCDSCQLRFEKVQRFSDGPLTVCPHCGGSVHRVIQPVGVIFKGSGFYVTDNRGKSSTMPPSKRDGESKPEGKSGEGESSTSPADPPAKTAESQSS
jgi:putative FmdB family regulatory protein